MQIVKGKEKKTQQKKNNKVTAFEGGGFVKVAVIRLGFFLIFPMVFFLIFDFSIFLFYFWNVVVLCYSFLRLFGKTI